MRHSITPRRRLLLISYRFPPEPYPLSISLRGVLDDLRQEWDIDVVTAAENAYRPPNVTIHHVPQATALANIKKGLSSVRLGKIAELLAWPDLFWPWITPALNKALEVVEQRSPDAALVFMMPFSTGFVGTRLKAKTGIPLVFNFDDSPTCSDMNPVYPSRLHYTLFRRMEDYFARTADRSVYVSRHNQERVGNRLPSKHREKLRLVRCSAKPQPFSAPVPQSGPEDPFRVVYTGAMSGWYDLDPTPSSLLKRAYHALNRLGIYVQTPLDYRSHSPVFVGKAIRRVLDAHPEWEGKIRMEVYGNTYPSDLVDHILNVHEIKDVVTLHGRIPSDEVPLRTQEADLLFLTLPNRLDGTSGGRISLKTYEYLMTDRPILAAVPPGENHEFLQEKPGTYLTGPTDVEAMTDVIETLVTDYLKGQTQSIDRSGLQDAFSHANRARALSQILEEAVESASHPRPVPIAAN